MNSTWRLSWRDALLSYRSRYTQNSNISWWANKLFLLHQLLCQFVSLLAYYDHNCSTLGIGCSRILKHFLVRMLQVSHLMFWDVSEHHNARHREKDNCISRLSLPSWVNKQFLKELFEDIMNKWMPMGFQQTANINHRHSYSMMLMSCVALLLYSIVLRGSN